MMDRVSKAFVVLSAAVALALLTWLMNRAWSLSIEVHSIIFIVAVIAGAVAEQAAIWILLAGLYLMPAAFVALGFQVEFTTMAMWLIALFGALLIDSLRRGWSFAQRFRAPLVLWALILAVGWPIAALRELDFHPSITLYARLASARIGPPPPVAVVWILFEALIVLMSLLWFDWLAARIRSRAEFHRRIITPLFVGIAIASAVATVQAFVDPGWLNRTSFGGSGRAAGTLLDGNAYGMLAAMWLPVMLVLAVRRSTSLATGIPAWLIFLCVLVGVWASGSRTAVLAAVVAAGLLGFGFRPAQLFSARRLVIAGAMAVGVVALLWVLPDKIIGPWERVRNLVPHGSLASVKNTVEQLWDRDHYGGAAVSMIAGHPLVGIGVGGFNTLVSDVAYINGFGVLPDNAQNWFRQELAELGALGSVGWIWWTVAFAGVLFAARSRKRDPVSAAARAGLVGMTAGSLLGMPAQNVTVALTFVTFAAWWLVDDEPQAAGAPGISRFEWAVIVTVVVAFGAGTYVNARGALRPPRRAVRGEWTYAWGISPAALADGSQVNRTTGHSVQVQRVQGGRYLELSFARAAPEDGRVHVRVWRKDAKIADVQLGDDRPLTYYVYVPRLEQMMMIETDSDRRPLVIAPWKFVGNPPPGSVVIR